MKIKRVGKWYKKDNSEFHSLVISAVAVAMCAIVLGIQIIRAILFARG